MIKTEPLGIDPLLQPLLSPIDEDQAGAILAQLLTTYAEPLIKQVIRYKLHFSLLRPTDQANADDLRQDVVLQLLSELKKFRERPDECPIADMRGLAAVIAHRACSRWMRRQFPERHALKNRLYYLLTRLKGLALWQDDHKKLVAGFADWRGQRAEATRDRLSRLQNDETMAPSIQSLKDHAEPGELGGVLAAIFNHLGSPVEFDKLVGALAGVLIPRDPPRELPDQNEADLDRAVSGEADAAWRVEKKMFLQRLWEEVCQLPLIQRTALLLNLRDVQGGGCIMLFPATGVASLSRLAEALEMTAENLAGMWNELPLEDARIAELLGLTRQQVINARKSARMRLTRELSGFI